MSVNPVVISKWTQTKSQAYSSNINKLTCIIGNNINVTITLTVYPHIAPNVSGGNLPQFLQKVNAQLQVVVELVRNGLSPRAR